MNVLITSAGRRTSLTKAFGLAVHACGGVLSAGDMDPLAPALQFADETICLVPVSDPDYVDRLSDIVESRSIKLIVPTIDTELMKLAVNAPRFAEIGCRVLVSGPEFVSICSDKASTIKAFGSRGFDVPVSWLPHELEAVHELPAELFIKPRDGSASRNAFKITREQVNHFVSIVPNPIVQEELLGTEITVDALLDFQGRPLHYVPRERIKTIGGESVQGVTITLSPEQHEWLVALLSAAGDMGASGPLTIQAFNRSNRLTLSEINPRFGGGFPLGYAAGANYPLWIMTLLNGEELLPRLGDYLPDVYMSRYYQEIITFKPSW